MDHCVVEAVPLAVSGATLPGESGRGDKGAAMLTMTTDGADCSRREEVRGRHVSEGVDASANVADDSNLRSLCQDVVTRNDCNSETMRSLRWISIAIAIAAVAAVQAECGEQNAETLRDIATEMAMGGRARAATVRVVDTESLSVCYETDAEVESARRSVVAIECGAVHADCGAN